MNINKYISAKAKVASGFAFAFSVAATMVAADMQLLVRLQGGDSQVGRTRRNIDAVTSCSAELANTADYIPLVNAGEIDLVSLTSYN